MVRNQMSLPSSIDAQTETALVLSFEDSIDDQERRIRYLARRGQEKMWRIEERRRDADWEVVDADPIEDLQLSHPNQVPEPERDAEVAV